MTHIRHVLGQQVLQRLTDGVALGDDSLAALVPGAVRVGHQSGGADDALQALLQQLTGTHLVVRLRIHDDPFVEVVEGGGELASADEVVLRS